jgi:hypothetical protein
MAYLRNHLQALVVWEAWVVLEVWEVWVVLEVLVLVSGVDEVYNLGNLFHTNLHVM